MPGFESDVVQIISHDGGLYGIDDYGQVYKFNFGKPINARSIEMVEVVRERFRAGVTQYEKRLEFDTKTIGRTNVGWQKLDNYCDVPEGYAINE